MTGLQLEAVEIPAGPNIDLAGDLALPSGPEGIVLFAHGSGSSRLSRRNRFVAEVLQEAGLGTLLFDLLTPEEEEAERYTRHLRFDIDLLAGRLVAATLWLDGRETTGNQPIGYFGASTGGGGGPPAGRPPGLVIG